MKEDILEQLVEDWLVAKKGWFVKHNIKYRPSKDHANYSPQKDAVNSDIDILGYCCTEKKAIDKVMTVTCKSWQGGFDIAYWFNELEKDPVYNEKSLDFQKRESWKYFREICSDKWIQAFVDKIEEETDQRDFTYCIAVTKIKKHEKKVLFENSRIIKDRFKNKKSNIKIKIIELKEIIQEYTERLKTKDTPALEGTDIGRMLQLISAAELKIV